MTPWTAGRQSSLSFVDLDHFFKKGFIEFVTILLTFYVLIFLATSHVDRVLNPHSLHWKVKS